MCGEEATLSLRRLSGENLLCTFSIPKSGGIGLRMAVNYLFPLKSSNNPPGIKYLSHFSIPKSGRTKLHFEEYNPFHHRVRKIVLKIGKNRPVQRNKPRHRVILL